MNTWLAENVYKPFSNPLFCPVRAAGVRLLLRKPLMRLLIKWIRRALRAFGAVLRVIQLSHTYAWLRDRLDDLDRLN